MWISAIVTGLLEFEICFPFKSFILLYFSFISASTIQCRIVTFKTGGLFLFFYEAWRIIVVEWPCTITTETHYAKLGAEVDRQPRPRNCKCRGAI